MLIGILIAAMFALSTLFLVDNLRRDRHKIAAALQGRSWASQSRYTMSGTVRRSLQPQDVQPALRREAGLRVAA